jgi:hypothetical protein
VPGPRTSRYYLQQDPDLRASGVSLPRATRTIREILTRHGRIAPPAPRQHEPLDRPPPLTSWPLDCKDVTTVPADPAAKRRHVVEALTCVDSGTSLLIVALVRAACTEETALAAVADLLRTHGLPQTLALDRDPRFVGSPGGGGFPAPLLRVLACLGGRWSSARRSAPTATRLASATMGRMSASACGSTAPPPWSRPGR